MNYSQQIEYARQRILNLERQKLLIEHEMQAWLKIIDGLKTLTEKPVFDEDGPPTREEFRLTERVRELLRSINSSIGATQIRDHFCAQGVEGSETKNFLINIHTVLKRLAKAGEVREIPLPDGSKVYEHVTLLQRVLASEVQNSPRARMTSPKRGGVLGRIRSSPSFDIPGEGGESLED